MQNMLFLFPLYFLGSVVPPYLHLINFNDHYIFILKRREKEDEARQEITFQRISFKTNFLSA